jgi:hypothetical protein
MSVFISLSHLDASIDWGLESVAFAATPEADALVSKLIAKYGQGTEELGQAQFAALLQDVLQEMAESLAENPITIKRDVKLLNGSHLRKVVISGPLLVHTVYKYSYFFWR